MVYKKKNSNFPEDSLRERLELEFKTCGLISICMTLFCSDTRIVGVRPERNLSHGSRTPIEQ